MIIKGRKIASQIKEELAFDTKPVFGVFEIVDGVSDEIQMATEKFVEIKKKFAEDVGVTVVEIKLPAKATTEEIVQEIKRRESEFDGIIFQFPLPKHIDLDQVRNAIPPKKDIDVVGDRAREEGAMYPPVVGAFKEILDRNSIEVKEKKVVIIGRGELVGKPSVIYFEKEGADVVVLGRDSDIKKETVDADILVLGAGVPGLITPDMIKEGVVILDAGTSEDQGKLAGDADPSCAEKASLFTPVPGGIGPITIAVLFKNLRVALD